MINNNEHQIWCERWRPQILSDFIGNEDIKEKIARGIADNDIPHILLFGSAGTGKTSLAKIIAKNTDCDYLYINASDTNGIDFIRDVVKEFASSVSFKTFKLIILDEADGLTPNGQSALRNIMETYSRGTRFILTCNYVERIIEPIQSRCQIFNVKPPSKRNVAGKLAHILTSEGIKYANEDVATIVTSCYPDIRKCINYAQQQVLDGELKLDKQTIVNQDYKLQLLEHLKNGTKAESFKNIRQLLADYEVNDFTDLYRFLYDEIDTFAVGHIAQSMLLIAEAQFKDASVIDKEINIMSLIIQLLNEIKTKG